MFPIEVLKKKSPQTTKQGNEYFIHLLIHPITNTTTTKVLLRYAINARLFVPVSLYKIISVNILFTGQPYYKIAFLL